MTILSQRLKVLLKLLELEPPDKPAFVVDTVFVEQANPLSEMGSTFSSLMLSGDDCIDLVHICCGHHLAKPPLLLQHDVRISYLKERLLHPDLLPPSSEELTSVPPVVPGHGMVVEKPALLQDVNLVEPRLVHLSGFEKVKLGINIKLKLSKVLLRVDLHLPYIYDSLYLNSLDMLFAGF